MVALGKRCAHPPEHPHRQLKLARYAAALPDAPPVIDWSKGVHGWGEYGNAGREYQPQLGDCAVVAPANAIRLWTAHMGLQRDLPLDAVLDAYRWAGGWEDGKPDTDQGCVISDVLLGWHTRPIGIGGDVLAAFVEVEHHDPRAIRQAIALFGCAILGVQLPAAAQGLDTWIDVPAPAKTIGVPSIWGGPFDLGGDWSPGSWGGHCILVVGYDVDGVTIVSWGNEVRVSWRWLSAYVDEAWAPLSQDWIAADRSPSGFDLAALQADLAALADTTEATP